MRKRACSHALADALPALCFPLLTHTPVSSLVLRKCMQHAVQVQASTSNHNGRPGASPTAQRVFMFDPNNPDSVQEVIVQPHEDMWVLATYRACLSPSTGRVHTRCIALHLCLVS